ncbi:hypothetical protein QBC41DRAFT_364113 [Cercophora samala]|uniref:F-box domain-containing protein n=1 Tax=Cercophora samala TaxID=330535 RepID=A0AA39ZFW1_9PEZI|nr:hypothetical protein QBC41DRAFT_364113 [Cercophora samala]
MKSLFPSRRKPPPAQTPGQDFFAHLPTELVILVLKQLPTSSDIISALHVCRNWRDILLSREIWPAVADHLTPGLTLLVRMSYDYSAEPRGFNSALNLHHLHQTGLFAHARHHVVRLNDKSFTVSKQVPVRDGGVHSLGDVPGLDPAAEEQHVTHVRLYSHGRVAWWPEAWHLPYFAVVDDLRSKVRRMFLFPWPEGGEQVRGEDRRRGWKTALGEKLFMLGQEDAGVCVWHLERDEVRRVEVPGGFDRCVVADDKLLFLGRGRAEIWIWQWHVSHRGVRTIMVDDPDCFVPGPVRMGGQIVMGYPRPAPKLGLRFTDTDVKIDFILHPLDWRVFWLVTWDEVELVVSEFHGGCMTGRRVCPPEHVAHRAMVRSRTDHAVHYLRTDRCDAHGGYVLMTAWIGEEPICDAGHVGSIVSVCFNIFTSEFSTFVHHASYQRTPAAHLWDGLLAVRVAGESENGLKPVVALLKPCHAHEDNERTIYPGDQMPVRLIKQPAATVSPAETTMTFVCEDDEIRPRAHSLHGMAYALEAGGDARQAGTDVMKAEWLSGDDKTLVYVCGRDYTVWMFGEDGACKEKKDGRLWKERFKNAIASSGRGSRD